MSYDPQFKATTHTQEGQIVDAGLQSFMRSVYNVMGLGLVVTGLSAYVVFNVEPLFNLIFKTPLFYVVAFAPLAFIFFGFTPNRMRRWPSSKVRGMFYLFSSVMGLSMASIFAVFNGADIARAFFITAGLFGAMSIYGYTTKKDLTSMGSFLFMGLIGIVIASIVNLFLASGMLQFIVSVVGVVVFTGLTAWETQRLKETYATGGADSAEANNKMAVMGALGLYLNFVNLFHIILSFMGSRD